STPAATVSTAPGASAISVVAHGGTQLIRWATAPVTGPSSSSPASADGSPSGHTMTSTSTVQAATTSAVAAPRGNRIASAPYPSSSTVTTRVEGSDQPATRARTSAPASTPTWIARLVPGDSRK